MRQFDEEPMAQRPYTVFMLLKAHAPWLALSAEQREAIYDDALLQVFNRFPSVRLRFFDASAFHSRCSDVLVWHTTDMPEYRAAVETLRSHEFMSYFESLDVIPSVPDGWREFDWDRGHAFV
jgi:hypothetical protein